MAETHSIARKKVWEKKSPEERFEIMSKVSFKKHAKLSEEEKRAYALKLVEARKKKQNG